MIKKLEKIFMPLAESIGKNKYLMSIRDGFLVSTPLLIIGSIFLLIGNFPITAWTEFIAAQGWAGFIGKPASATFDIMAILAVIGIAYAFAGRMNVDKIFGAATALVSWYILMPFTIDKVLESGEAITVSGIPFAWVGSRGIFIGIACAFLAVHIYSWVNSKGWVIKMPEGVPPTVEQSFSALIPAGITIFVFFALNWIFALTPYNSAFQFIFEILQAPLLSLGNTLGAMVIEGSQQLGIPDSIVCVGRLRCGIRSCCADGSVLEENDKVGCICRYIRRRCNGIHMEVPCKTARRIVQYL